MIGELPVVYVTDELIRRTGELLATFAADHNWESEGLVYWFGLELGSRSLVTTLIVPDADTTRGDIRTSAAANAEALGVIIGTPLVLLGQAHSHPFDSVRHSAVDDRDTFAQFNGALSVVVPFFGRQGLELAKCGVHRHIAGRYRRIPNARLADHLQVLPGIRDFRRGGERRRDD
jgi:hypothetical protein